MQFFIFIYLITIAYHAPSFGSALQQAARRSMQLRLAQLHPPQMPNGISRGALASRTHPVNPPHNISTQRPTFWQKVRTPALVGGGIGVTSAATYWTLQPVRQNFPDLMPTAHADTELPQHEKVRIYHDIGTFKRGKKATIESVKKHGLLTRNELWRRGLATEDPSKYSNGLLSDQYDVIYFEYRSPESAYAENKNSIALEVDPEKTYVYNRKYRCDDEPDLYWGSKVLLSKYIANKKLAEEMRKNAPPGMAVVFNPGTSEPFYVSTTDPRYYSATNPRSYYLHLYDGEIIIQRNQIPPEELIFPDEIH